MLRLTQPTPSQRRRAGTVIVMLVAMMAGAFLSSWLFYAGLAAFVVMVVAEVLTDVRKDFRLRRDRLR